MQQLQCDVLVAGAGPNGVKVANQLLDFDTLLIDKGGICSGLRNLPGDFEMASQTQYNLGITLTGKGDDHLVSVGELSDYFQQLNQARFEQTALLSLSGEDNHFTATTSTGTISARKVIIATGIMDSPKPVSFVKNASVSRYISHEPLQNQHILVVGGGDTAALTVLRHATHNTIHWVYRSSTEALQNKIFRLYKAQIAEVLPQIQCYPYSQVEYIHQAQCVLRSGQQIAFDKGFVLTGYEPDFALLNACHLQVDSKHKPVHNLRTCQSSTPGIYYCGIIMGNAEVEGVVKTPFLKDADYLASKIANHVRSELTE